jgi:cold shock CspA family protein
MGRVESFVDANYPVKEGDTVTFMVERGPKGWSAVDVAKKA